jgi:hypothetical protein
MDLVQRDIVTATTKTAAFIALARYLEANPDERDKLQVVPLHELAA